MTELKKIDYKTVLIVSGIGIILLLPFLASFSYSIDDYHLLQLYNIDIEHMGYNYYSTGRFVEGIIAEFLSWLNLLPVNKPFGQAFFLFAMALLAVYIADVLEIENNMVKVVFSLLIVFNPFLAELYYYSTATVFCGFATLFLFLGFLFSVSFTKERKFIYVLLSILCYYCSLGTYQIFYPIVFYVFVFWFLEKLITGVNIREVLFKSMPLIVIYLGSFILFYLVMKIAFIIEPPFLQYNMDNPSNMLSSFLSKDFWFVLIYILKSFLLEDNYMNSSLIFWMVWFIQCYIVFVILCKNCSKRKTYIRKILFVLGRFFVFEILIIIGFVSLAGFNITSPGNLSYRSFVAYGILIALLLYLIYKHCDLTIGKNAIMCVMIIVALSNGIRFGRVALDTYRLNTIENNLANRIVYRLEELEDFNPSARVVMIGTPNIMCATNYGVGSYNTPALSDFSKILVLNEISGYNFQLPTQEDYDLVNQNLESIGCWPSENSVIKINDVYVVRFN